MTYLASYQGGISPIRSDKKALTSVAYWRASNKGIKCRRSISVGSLIQPSMGIALSIDDGFDCYSGVSRNVALNKFSPTET